MVPDLSAKPHGDSKYWAQWIRIGKPGTFMPGFDIARHLARHGVDAQVKRLPATDEAAATLLSYAADSDTDLMVMGGYGHSRLREFVLGGTTRNILSSMTVPVLMSH